MKFKVEPDESGYFLYAYIDGEWKLICFRLTLIGAKFRHGDTQDIIRKAENLSYEVIQWNISRNARNVGGI